MSNSKMNAGDNAIAIQQSELGKVVNATDDGSSKRDSEAAGSSPPCESHGPESKSRSFDPFMAHFFLKDRLEHNVNIELAKADRTRTFNELACQHAFLMKLLTRRNEPEDTTSLSFSRLELLDDDAMEQEANDARMTLQVVALRTLCEAVMHLPAELRGLIYGFLLYDPNREFRLTIKGDFVYGFYCACRLQVTSNGLFRLVERPYYEKVMEEDQRSHPLEDKLVLGPAMHRELIAQHFETCKFTVEPLHNWPFPSTDQWGHGIDPRETIKNLTFTMGDLVPWEAPATLSKNLDDQIEYLKPLLQRCRKGAHWILKWRSPYKDPSDHERLDPILADIVTRLISIDIPNQESITIELSSLGPRKNYKGPLDLWIDIFRETADDTRIKSFEYRFSVYEAIQGENGRKVPEFRTLTR